MKTDILRVKSDYEYVESNIYKTGSKYRTRVGPYSEYNTTITAARKARTRFRKQMSSDPVI
jgi:hypothetical protein